MPSKWHKIEENGQHYHDTIFIILFLVNLGYGQNSELTKEDTIIVNSRNSLAREFIINGDYLKADSIINLSLKLLENVNFKSGFFNALTNKGVIYWYQDNYPKALEFQLRALHVAELMNNKLFISRALANIGLIYASKNGYDKALDYYHQSLKIKREIGDKKAIVILLSNMAKIYDDKNDEEHALDYYSQSLKVAQDVKNITGMIALNYEGIGNIYKKQGKFAKATFYFENAFRIADSLQDKKLISSTLVNIGSLQCLKGDHKTAELNLNKALKIAIDIGNISNQKEAYFKLSEVYGKLNKWDLSLLNYKKYIKAQDSIFNQDNTKKMVRLEMNYEFDKKEASTKIEQQKKEVDAQAESKKQKIIILSIAAILILVLVFAIYVFRSLKERQRINVEITHQKHTIEEKQKEILDSIYYAKRIQTALITSERYIERSLNKLISKPN